MTVQTMNLQRQLQTMAMKAKLSTLWMFFLINIIFRDIDEFVEPGFMEEVLTGTVNGNPVTPSNHGGRGPSHRDLVRMAVA